MTTQHYLDADNFFKALTNELPEGCRLATQTEEAVLLESIYATPGTPASWVKTEVAAAKENREMQEFKKQKIDSMLAMGFDLETIERTVYNISRKFPPHDFYANYRVARRVLEKAKATGQTIDNVIANLG